jgi:hypothetical protein
VYHKIHKLKGANIAQLERRLMKRILIAGGLVLVFVASMYPVLGARLSMTEGSNKFGVTPHSSSLTSDLNAPPARRPVNGNPTISHNLLGRVIDVFGGASNLGYGSGYPGPFPAPYGGQGPNASMDLVFPESNITLFANVTYDDAPVQSVDVSFGLVGPSSSVTLHAVTDAAGSANVTYSMPWSATVPQNFTGLWRVTANVTASGVAIYDTLTFFYDYPVHIWRVTTDKYYYDYGEICTVNYVYGTLVLQSYPALFKVDLENSTGVPFGVGYVITTIYGSVFGVWHNSTYTVNLFIPLLPGVGGYSYVHVKGYDKDPSVGGFNSVRSMRRP